MTATATESRKMAAMHTPAYRLTDPYTLGVPHRPFVLCLVAHGPFFHFKVYKSQSRTKYLTTGLKWTEEQVRKVMGMLTILQKKKKKKNDSLRDINDEENLSNTTRPKQGTLVNILSS